MYSSSSGGGSGGYGEEMLVVEVVTLCGWASTSGCSSEMLVEGVVTSCGWVSTTGCAPETSDVGVLSLCGCSSPAKANASADCFACLDKALYVLRKCSALPALNHIKDRKAQAMTRLRTRFER